MAGPHQQGAPRRPVRRGWTAGVTAIVIDTSALLDAAARAAVVRFNAASRLELALVAESARHGIDATEVEQPRWSSYCCAEGGGDAV